MKSILMKQEISEVREERKIFMNLLLSTKQINDMKHCIGFRWDLVKKGKYESYRNYYNNGDEQDDGWEALVGIGHAKRFKRFDQFIYCLTDDGIKNLEVILDVIITKRD